MGGIRCAEGGESMKFMGARLRQARLARGLTAKALADAVEVSPSIVSGYEAGKKTPSPETLDRLASILDVPVRLLHKRMPEETHAVHDVFYRSVSSTTRTLREKLNQRAAWMCEVFDFVEQHFNFSDINLPELDLPKDFRNISEEMIEDAAAATRECWEVEDGPLPDLMDLMETQGVTVSKFSFGSDKMDGFSFWHKDSFPMVVLATDKESRSRSRFDLAHELGHLVLNHSRGENPDPEEVRVQEDQANRFASAFLLPKEAVSVDFDEALASAYRKSVLNSLWPLKLKWKVSIAALLYRARDIDKINSRQYKSAYVMLSQRGWRKSEPLEEELPEEQPDVLRLCIEQLVGDGDYTPSEIHENIALPVGDIVDICRLPVNFFEERRDIKRPIRTRKRDLQ